MNEFSDELFVAGVATPNCNESTLIRMFAGEEIAVSVLLYDRYGTAPIDLTGGNLIFAIVGEPCQHIATIGTHDITIAGSDSSLLNFFLPPVATA